MKTKYFVAALAALTIACFASCKVQAQEVNVTNAAVMPSFGNPTISGGLQQLYDATTGSTNFAVAIGGGRSLKGNYNLLFADYLYNFNQNVGAVLGFDDIAEGSKFTTQDICFVKGGLNLQAEIAPFKSFAPNFKVTPFGSLLMSSGNGRVGQIVVAGANYKLGIGKGWCFNLGGFYENRSGDGLPTDRAFAAGNLAVSRGF